MKPSRLFSIVLVVVATACGSSSEPGGGSAGMSGTGGVSGSGGTGSPGGSAGVDAAAGGAAGSAAGGGGAAGGAAGAAGSGDARDRAKTYARDIISCGQDSECCVVFDMCRNEGYLVAAADQQTVKDLLAKADQSLCTNCIPPPVQAWCNMGTCKAVKTTCTSGTLVNDAMHDHCGKVALPAGCSAPQSHGGLPFPGLQPETILGCGS